MQNRQSQTVFNEIKLGTEEFNFFRAKIFSLAGINMSDAKMSLVQARLRARILKLGLKDFRDYVSYLETIPQSHEEWESFINLLTTNKTDWFREPEHFDFIESEFLPRWKKLGKTHLNVWCAASSTGEEPYTISLVLNSALRGSGITYSIVASDIDTKVLQHAQNGVYLKNRLEQVPEKYHSGFSFGTGDISDWMKVKKEIKSHVTFRQVNLTQYPFSLEGTFDLVMCRNVLIYFNPQTIKQVVNNIFQMANKDSTLIIAHAESLQNIKTSWKYKGPSIYYKGNLF